MKKLEIDLDGDAVKQIVPNDIGAGEKLGVSETLTLLINGRQ